MKKLLFLTMFLFSGVIGFSQIIGEGDLVPNIFWKDSDGGEAQMKHLYDITAQGKYVWIDFSSTNCSFCNLEAPILEESWQHYGKDLGDVYVVTSMFYINETGWNAPGLTWEQLNGSAWRTAFDPPLSFYLCSKDTGLYNYMYNVPENPINFNVEGFPRNVLIGPDNIVAKYTAGFNMNLHEEIEATINEGLGILPPANLEAVLAEDDSYIALAWDVSESSENYSPLSYTVYKNGDFLTEIADINTTEYIDEDIENGLSYFYQITATYQREGVPELQIESMKSEQTDPILVGGLGEGEWMYYGSGPFNQSVGVSRPFAYAIDFDLGETEYIIKAIEVANLNNGTVDWRIVELGDGLVKGEGDLIHCGNELIGTLEGTINTVADFEPVLHTFTDTTRVSGQIAVVALASMGNKSLASGEEENHADWYSEDSQTDWDWIHLAADLQFPKTWYLRIFAQDMTYVGIKEFSNTPQDFISTIYPNPSSGNANVGFFLSDETDVVLSIYNINGQLVQNVEVNSPGKGYHEYQIKCNTFPKGVYNCLLKSNKEVHSKLFVVK